MTASLVRVNAVPVQKLDAPFEFTQWLANLVDTVNSDLDVLQLLVYSRSVTSSVTEDMAVNSAYIVGNAAQTTFTLPATAAVGSIEKIIGFGAGGWVLKPFAGQTIQVLGSTANISITSSNQYDCIEVMCVVANTTWVTTSSQTAGFVIL